MGKIMNKFMGTGVALVTPFTSDLAIDYPALKKLINHLDRDEINYYVIMGTTGESATLNWSEKIGLLQFCKNNISNKPIVFGLGGNNTLGLLDQIKIINKIGVDAILSVTPYYNKPSQAGLIAHFEMIAEASKAPIILYNIPSRTATNMEATTVIALAEHPNIIGIKEASGDLEQCQQIMIHKPIDFILISGNDQDTVEILQMGGCGTISVVANYKPVELGNIVIEMMAGRAPNAKKINESLLKYYALMMSEGNPTSVKTALKTIGICQKYVRLPLIEGSKALEDKFIKA